MRTFIFGLAAILPAFAIDLARAADDTVPTFDITRNCKEETTGVGGSASCTKDETEAKNRLTQRWSSFGASQKRDCIGESSTGGEKSYVELLICLEMSTGQYSPNDSQKR